jgi:hypothetical protein
MGFNIQPKRPVHHISHRPMKDVDKRQDERVLKNFKVFSHRLLIISNILRHGRKVHNLTISLGSHFQKFPQGIEDAHNLFFTDFLIDVIRSISTLEFYA